MQLHPQRQEKSFCSLQFAAIFTLGLMQIKNIQGGQVLLIHLSSALHAETQSPGKLFWMSGMSQLG